ncbi:hypothetical protein Prum_004610 [Phytohabitans rumicis]|uniref:Flippase-like domain-containing protein n=1 Tax=Phytohabitans rumicis TaxID=1076125 RepID=A0A6V8KWZ7_9ACTN|nr:hypothetical protein Prum_004610 [Phytohabitans rumicis]
MTSRALLALLPPAAVAGYATWKWPSLVTAGRALVDADPTWLAVGVCAVALTYVAGAVSQQGAVPRALPRRRLYVAQLAGVCANALVPAGLGAAAVSHRFLRRCGVSNVDAVTALALNSLAGAAIQATILVGLCLAAPDRVPVGRLERGPVQVLVLSVAVLAVAGAVAWILTSSRRRVLLKRVREQLAVVRATLANPRRALLLFGGSAAGPLLQAITIMAVLHAIGRPLPALDVFVAYLAASAAAALVPSPGSVGSLDIMLGITLAGVGADPQTAVTAVLGYRLLGTWLPLLPSALALAYLPGRASDQATVKSDDHRMGTVADVQLGEDAQQMRLHRGLGDHQPLADVDIGQSISDGIEHIHLPRGQRRLRRLPHPCDQSLRDPRREHGLAPGSGANRVGELLAGGVLEQVPDRAGFDRAFDVGVRLVRGEDQHPGTGAARDDLGGGPDAVEPRHPQVDQCHIGRQPLDEVDGLPAVGRFGDDLDARFGGEQRDHPGPHDRVVVDHDDAQLLVRHVTPDRSWEAWRAPGCPRRESW